MTAIDNVSLLLGLSPQVAFTLSFISVALGSIALYLNARSVRTEERDAEAHRVQDLILFIQGLEKEFLEVKDQRMKANSISRLFNSLDLLAFHCRFSIRNKRLRKYTAETLLSFSSLYHEARKRSLIDKESFPEFRNNIDPHKSRIKYVMPTLIKITKRIFPIKKRV